MKINRNSTEHTKKNQMIVLCKNFRRSLPAFCFLIIFVSVCIVYYARIIITNYYIIDEPWYAFYPHQNETAASFIILIPFWFRL